MNNKPEGSSLFEKTVGLPKNELGELWAIFQFVKKKLDSKVELVHPGMIVNFTGQRVWNPFDDKNLSIQKVSVCTLLQKKYPGVSSCIHKLQNIVCSILYELQNIMHITGQIISNVACIIEPVFQTAIELCFEIKFLKKIMEQSIFMT